MILTQFFEELHNMTDWVFTVLMGGPQPSTGGTLDVSSFHVGKKKMGNRFSQAYPHFSQNIMVSYTQFVERILPKAAALSKGKGLLPSSTTSTTLAITPEPSSDPDILVSNTSTFTPTPAAANIAFKNSMSPMNMGGNTSLSILPIPPQAHDDAIRSLNELLWDVSHENTLEQGHTSLSNIASPQLPDVLVPGLTDDILDIDSNPNQVVAPPIIPHQPIEPTFRFPASTLPPNLESPGESSSCMPHNQTLCAVEAPPIAPRDKRDIRAMRAT
ncbi:hypothetical protein P692DRAFT_20881592 [Suillus brevipes Sb2]|nr:hypothetical protein P692DRAFT_20881592 [Suillus brevipes Sb2]